MTGGGARGRKMRVITEHRVVHTDPMALQAGDVVQVGRRDDEWSGWLWCTNAAGKSGWVPESYLDRQGESGVVRCDYTTRELSVVAGQVLTAGVSEAGWVWVTNEAGDSGWVPEKHLEPS